MVIKFNWSYSSMSLYLKSQLQFYYQYILKIPQPDKTIQVYGKSGNIVHKAIEAKINKEDYDFDKEWMDSDLNHEPGFNGKPLSLPIYKRCFETGSKILRMYKLLDYTFQAEESYLFKYNDNVNLKGFVDLIIKKNDTVILADWKTSTSKKAGEFHEQMMFYAWLYWKQTGIVVNKCQWFYLKIQKEDSIKPTLRQIKLFEEKQLKLIQEILDKGDDITQYSQGDFLSNPWNGFKSLIQDKPVEDKIPVKIIIKDAKLYFKDISEEDIKTLSNHFQYEVNNAYFIKKAMLKRGVRYDGIVRFYNHSHNTLPIGFLNSVKELLDNYIIIDERIKLKDYKMPDRIKGITFAEHQEKAINYAVNNSPTALEVATGGGKTLAAAEIIRRNKGLSLFIVDVGVLLTQTVKVFEKSLGMKIGTITKGEKDIKVVNVATIQTINALLKKKDKEMIQILYNVKTLIIDETHGASTKSYTNMSKYIVNANLRVGLTGTYERVDGAIMDIESVVGKNEFIIPASELIEKGYLTKPKIIFYKYDSCNKIGSTFHDYYTLNITENEIRNDLAIEKVKEFKGENILIIVSELDHGRRLQKRIPDSVFIEGEIGTEDRDRFIQEMRDGNRNIIIGTAKIIQKGLDIVNLKVGINLTGNSSPIITKQFLGRLLRKDEGKTECFYIDFYDKGEYFGDHRKDRIKTLEKEGYEVIIK